MSGFVDVLAIVVVAVLVISRLFRASRVDTERRWWLPPVVLGLIALREPGLLDAHHLTASTVLLGAELLVGLAVGAAWALTTRIWTEPDGSRWSKGSGASAAAWAVGAGMRAGLHAVGVAADVHQDSSALLLGLACTLLVRGAIVAGRAHSLPFAVAVTPTYGDGTIAPAGRGRA